MATAQKETGSRVGAGQTVFCSGRCVRYAAAARLAAPGAVTARILTEAATGKTGSPRRGSNRVKDERERNHTHA